MPQPVVIIVGGGPAGAVTATVLARHGFSAVVLEAERGPTLKVGECLPPNVNPLLDYLGIKEKLRDSHLPSYGNRAVWGSVTPFERDFIYGPHGAGWHLDRRSFEETLTATAIEAGADWRYGSRLIKCSERKGGWRLKVRSPSGDAELEADFVVDATGRSMRFMRELGLRRVHYDRLVGIALSLKSQRSVPLKDSFTLVEAAASGWWYSSLLPSGDLMLIYMTDGDLLAEQKTLRHKEGLLALLKKTDDTRERVRVGEYVAAGEPQVYGASSERSSRIAGERWLAVGDAAASYDPLSSYGINAAMGAGFHAASAVADFFAGRERALQSYAAMMDRAYARYLIMNYGYYGLERRWPREEFWRRRHSPQF